MSFQVPLTDEEYRYLLIARQDENGIVALGDRMKETMLGLYTRGLMAQSTSHVGNVAFKITHNGRTACDEHEDVEVRGLIDANNQAVESRTLVSKDLRLPGTGLDHSLKIAIAQLVGMIEGFSATSGSDPSATLESVISEIRRQHNAG